MEEARSLKWIEDGQCKRRLVFTLVGTGKTCLNLSADASSRVSARVELTDDECALRQGSMIRLFFSPPRKYPLRNEPSVGR